MKIILEKHYIEAIAEKMKSVYEWILSPQTKPQFLYL
jgi:hypothetical protein